MRLQSMTNTDTRDTDATVKQAIKIHEAGGELVRITVPSMKDVESLKVIKTRSRESGYDFPLVADVHFNPRIARLAAAIVDKVRINPGNYTDKKDDEARDMEEVGYAKSLERIKLNLVPLLSICREHGTAIRVGVNHGSLSSRIMDRYGDTPEGMAESAMEFARVCKGEGFQNLVLSMKASNTRVMVYATRLLVKKMITENMYYPLHLGVTEAGEGEDGRIRSACGIGALLADGIGDTIRVSLTEDPEEEIPVARAIARHFEKQRQQGTTLFPEKSHFNPHAYNKRETAGNTLAGGSKKPLVMQNAIMAVPPVLEGFGWYHEGEWCFDEMAADIVLLENPMEIPAGLPDDKTVIVPYHKWASQFTGTHRFYPLYSIEDLGVLKEKGPWDAFFITDVSSIEPALLDTIKEIDNLTLVVSNKGNGIHGFREAIRVMDEMDCHHPVVARLFYDTENPEEFTLFSSADAGSLFIDGLVDGIWLDAPGIGNNLKNSVAFGILQAAGARITRTEYISCPSCGRTRFNLMETLKEVKAKTSHLKGLKIAVMGCIVNGPGEMADADYGYVGSGPGKVTLYRGRQVVKKNIPSQNAVDELLSIIDKNG